MCIIVAVGVGTGLGVCCKRRQRERQNIGSPDVMVTEHDEVFVMAAPVEERSPWASIEIER